MYFDFFLLDLLPNRCDFDSVIMPPQRHKRTVYTAEQKSTLEATFRDKMYLSREEKATLASKLNVGIAKVQVCSGKYSLFSWLNAAVLIALFYLHTDIVFPAQSFLYFGRF